MGRIEALLAKQQGHLFPWLAIAFACGVGGYFSLRFEPGPGVWAGLLGLFVILGLLLWRGLGALAPVAWGLLFVILGFGAATWRAHHVAGPLIDWRYYGPIEGRVVAMDRSASDAVRLTLDQVILKRVSLEETPRRIRVSLHGDAAQFGAPLPGARVMTTAHLGPPGGAVEPGGFDFQRHAWFLKLGAVGYTRVPVLALEPAPSGLSLIVFRIRMTLSQRVQEVLPGDVGGFAAAVTTGDRSGISQEALEALRAANTAHLLAISGLHMGLLSAFIFGLLRIGLALIPAIALRWPVRKVAAGGALIVASLYLALSGGNVATERAFIMVLVALLAIMADRRALSLRSVAIAALIVLTLRPEALLGPGFQMSFAATTALVFVFQRLRGVDLGFGVPGLQGVTSVLLSSAVAGLATAPIGAAHFNALAHYGLIANLLSVPLMGILVIPAAVFAALLGLVGLEAVGLWVMGWGLRWILEVSQTVASWDGSRSFVPGPQAYVLPVLVLSLLFVILWQGRTRWIGLVPAVIALGLWTFVQRPAVLIAEGGALVGVMTSEGRALSRDKGAGFIASNWLENDGDPSDQALAAARWSEISKDSDIPAFLHVRGKRGAEAFDGCRPDQIVVTNVELAAQGCTVFDPKTLKETGAIALHETPDGFQTRSVRDVTGDRLWSQWPKARQQPPRLAGAQ